MTMATPPLDDAALRQLAERYGTPLYVYDLDAIGERVTRLRGAFPNADLRFAVKANPAAGVLAHLAAAGVGAEAITVGEYARALRAGISPERVVLGGPAQDAALQRLARSVPPDLISLDGEGMWASWQHRGKPIGSRYLVRVNPALDPATHPHLATGESGSKFGVAPQLALELAAAVDRAGVFAGFHVHAGSMLRDLRVHRDVLTALDPLFAAYPQARVLNLGGGLAVPDYDLDALAELVLPWVAARGLQLVLEPGRMLVAEAGTLLTRVLHVKEGVRRHLIADAGMADLIRPALYDAHHPVRLLRPAAEATDAIPTDLDGPLCENGDRLARNLNLGAVRPGDLLAVDLAGAYGWTMGSWYASHTRVGEVAVQAGHDLRLRETERVQDLWAHERDPDPHHPPGRPESWSAQGGLARALMGMLAAELHDEHGRWSLAIDFASGEWLRYGAEELHPAASTIKLLLLGAALDPAVDHPELSERITVAPDDMVGGSGVIYLLSPGLTPTFGDLVRLMITHSDNTATNMVLDRIGVDAVNAWGEARGLQATRIAGRLHTTPDRWTEAQKRGERARATALELSRLIRGVSDPAARWLPAAACELAAGMLRQAAFRDSLLRHHDSQVAKLGAKAGWLIGVRHDVGVWHAADGAWLASAAVLCSDHPDDRYHLDHRALRTLGRVGAAIEAMLRRR
jgi:diaminopimelate decarboxylase